MDETKTPTPTRSLVRWQPITVPQLIGYATTIVTGAVIVAGALYGAGVWVEHQKDVQEKQAVALESVARAVDEVKTDVKNVRGQVDKIQSTTSAHDATLTTITTAAATQASAMIVMHDNRDKEIRAMNDRADRQEAALTAFAKQTHDDISDINRRFDEWLTERRTENQQREVAPGQRRLNFPP